MGKSRENMLEAFKASHDQTVRNRKVAQAVEAARLVRTGGAGGQLQDAHAQGLPAVVPAASGGSARSRGADAELLDAPQQDPAGRAPVRAHASVLPVEQPNAPQVGGRRVATTDLQQVRAGLVLPMGWAPFLVLQTMILAVAFGLGWIASGMEGAGAVGGDGVLAAGGGLVLDSPGTKTAASGGLNSPLRFGRTPAVLGAVGGSQGGQNPEPGAALDTANWPADLAFDGQASRFTVVVAQYNDTVFGRARAWEAFEFLVGQGLPVVSPRARNRVVYLFVGASAERAELDQVLEQVKDQTGARGREKPFYDAYVSNISRYR